MPDLAYPEARSLKLALGLLLGFSLAATASAQQSGTINQLFAFTCFGGSNNDSCPQGARPDLIIQASDGNFYGGAQVTDEGVSNPQGGTLFKLTPAGQFTKLFTFTQNGQGQFLNGNNPVDGFLEANDGFLYGTTFNGGSHNDGVLFRISKSRAGFRVLHNFCSKANCADGSLPIGLVLGRDGNIYGSTQGGGSSGNGTIFRFVPATGSFTTVHTLNGTTDGSGPSALTLASDGNFYGLDRGPDVNSSVFRFVPSTGQFTIQFTLPSFDLAISTALVQGANGNLFGAFEDEIGGHDINYFEVRPDGTGFQTFPPFAPLEGVLDVPPLFLASDGNLWGTNFGDSTFADGSVITLNPEGVVFQSFGFNGTNGQEPDAAVIQGSDGKIYGTAIGGGTISGGRQKFADGTVWNLDAGLPLPSPSVALLNPTSGSIGSTVLINGNNFVGATSVSFNGTSASFKILNLHFISATVPAGATSGPVTVTTAGGSSTSAQAFSVK